MPEHTGDRFLLSMAEEFACDAKPVLAIGRILRILRVEIAAGETQVVNSIQQIGFTHAIVSGDTNHFLIKINMITGIVFKLDQRYGG